MMTTITMLKKPEDDLMLSPCLSYHSSDGSDENYDGEGELEIDLDYNEYGDLSMREQEQPLDLSVKKIGHEFEMSIPKLPTLDVGPTFIFSSSDKIEEIKGSSTDNKESVVTEAEIADLLDPFVKRILKKFSCKICTTKFVNKLV